MVLGSEGYQTVATVDQCRRDDAQSSAIRQLYSERRARLHLLLGSVRFSPRSSPRSRSQSRTARCLLPIYEKSLRALPFSQSWIHFGDWLLLFGLLGYLFQLVLCLEPFSGMSLVLWCFLSVFTGHETVLISPQEMEMNPAVWFSTLSQHSARDTFVSSSVIQTWVSQLPKQVDMLKTRGINLNSLRNCVIVTEERPRASFISQFLLLFKPLGLNDKVLASAFGCRVNPAVCFHCNGLSTDTSAVFVSKEALRFDKSVLLTLSLSLSLGCFYYSSLCHICSMYPI